MKRIGIIALAIVLVLGLTQCKKEQNAQTNENETVAITLDIRNGGTRMDVNTVTGEVNYEAGDVIYVVSSGKYIGTLTHNGTNFSGPITNPTVGEPLHFYFLGNVTPAETLTAGTTESCSVVISDQTTHLPVIEYAPSDETYTAGATAFTAFLLNKCALVKFNVTTSSEAATCVTGFNNKVTVDFTDASFSYSQTNGGNITLPSGSGEKWAILLPQEAMEAGESGSAYSQDGAYTGTCGAVPAILENGYLTAGISIIVDTLVDSVPIGAINGLFTINSNGDQVYFSQGNLQYQASTNIWRFADEQFDYIGGDNCNISENYEGWIDLFAWGSGNNPVSFGCCDTFSDWGNNPISNGGNTSSQWRTLSNEEWSFLLFDRTTLSGLRFVEARVNGVHGVIILPDNWDCTVSWNPIDSETWNCVYETNGAVFLPAAGRLFYNSYYNNYYLDNQGRYGFYLSATPTWCIYFWDDNENLIYFGIVGGQNSSVRLVRDVE
jgi:hypothetical protein